MVPTLGLTGVTVNAMALIAPGAFLWITFVQQAGYAYPSGMAMWAGIFVALMSRVRDRAFVLGTGKALSGCGQLVSVRRAGVPEHDHGVQVRAHREVRDRMGVASLLLGISRRHGGHDGRHDRLYRRHARAGIDERGDSGAGFHGLDRDNLRVRGRLHRIPRRQRLDRWSISRSTEFRSSRCCFSRRWRSPIASAHPAGSMGLGLDANGNTVAAKLSLRVDRRSPVASPARSRSSCRIGLTG